MTRDLLLPCFLLPGFVLLVAAPAASGQCATWKAGFARPLLQDTGHALAVYAGAGGPELVIGGQFSPAGAPPFFNRIVGWDGASWSLAMAGPNGTVRALQVFDDGSGPKLYAGGEIASGLPSPFIGAWNGASWNALGSGVDGTVTCFTVYDDGAGRALYVGGQFNHAGGVLRPRIARYDASGWSSVGAGLPVLEVLAIEAHDDGSGLALYAGTDAGIAKWNGATWDTSFAPATGPVRALRSFRGDLHAGGDFTAIAGSGAAFVARWDGAIWSALGSGVDGRVNVLRAHDDGAGLRLFAGGSFTHAGGVASSCVARWNGIAWSATAAGIAGETKDLLAYDDGSGTKLFATGGCVLLDGTIALNIVRWDGVVWSAVSQGLTGAVLAVEPFDAGTGERVYVAGGLTNAAGHSCTPVVRWSGSGWESLPDGLGGPAGSVSALVRHDAGSGAELYAGGSFALVAGVSAVNVARYDGTSWNAVGGYLGGNVEALAAFDFGSGLDLVAIGGFPGFAARWDGTAWSVLPGLVAINPQGGAPFGIALGVAVLDAGAGPELYVGGYFGVAADGAYSIARWNGTQWAGIGSVTHPSWVAGDIQALLAFDDGAGPALYAAGRFNAIGGMPVSSLARWNGSAWSTVSGYPYGGMNHVTWGLGLADLGDGAGTRLIAAPDGGSILGWNGASWDFVAQPNGFTSYLDACVLRAPGAAPELWLAGQYFGIEGLWSQGVACAETCPETGRLVCLGDGSGTSCPCGNASAPSERAGCANSGGLGGALRALGSPSLAQDALAFQATGLADSPPTLFFQGTRLVAGGAGAVFGDGLRCVAGTVRRLVIRAAVAGTVTFGPAAGDAPIHTLGQVECAGSRRAYQAWYRNSAPFCTASTFNLTNAVEIVWEL